MADAKRRAFELVHELSPVEAAHLTRQLDEFLRLPIPKTYFEAYDFCRAAEHFRRHLHAVECGAKPSLLGPTAYMARYGPIGAEVP